MINCIVMSMLVQLDRRFGPDNRSVGASLYSSDCGLINYDSYHIPKLIPRITRPLTITPEAWLYGSLGTIRSCKDIRSTQVPPEHTPGRFNIIYANKSGSHHH